MSISKLPTTDSAYSSPAADSAYNDDLYALTPATDSAYSYASPTKHSIDEFEVTIPMLKLALMQHYAIKSVRTDINMQKVIEQGEESVCNFLDQNPQISPHKMSCLVGKACEKGWAKAITKLHEQKQLPQNVDLLKKLTFLAACNGNSEILKLLLLQRRDTCIVYDKILEYAEDPEVIKIISNYLETFLDEQKKHILEPPVMQGNEEKRLTANQANIFILGLECWPINSSDLSELSSTFTKGHKALYEFFLNNPHLNPRNKSYQEWQEDLCSEKQMNLKVNYFDDDNINFGTNNIYDSENDDLYSFTPDELQKLTKDN